MGLLLIWFKVGEAVLIFEAVLGFCLVDDPTTCRDVLLPGFEAASQAGCEALLSQHPPEITHLSREKPQDAPFCQSQGEIADFIEVRDGVFVHRGIISDANRQNYGDVANVGFVIGESAVAVIDSGGSFKFAEEIYRAIRSETDLPIRYVILTHMHPDHVLGASLFAQAGAEVIGHEKLTRALQDRAQAYLTNFGRLIEDDTFIGTQIALPDRLVEAQENLDLGGRSLVLKAWPNAHTGTDVTVGDPTSGILFTGDLMFHEHAPALDGTVLGWLDVLQEMQALPYTQIMPGHGGPILDWPVSAAPLRGYLDLLITDTRAAIARGDRLGVALEVIAQSQSEDWQLFDLFNPRNATVAFTELEWE